MFIEDTLYREILNVMPIPTVDILFLSLENKILLGKRDNEPLAWIYYIPGGRVNKWETSLETAKRKAKEELGIDIDVKKLSFLWVYDDIFENSVFGGISTHCIPVTYIYRLSWNEERMISPSDNQHSDLRFFPIDDPSLHHMVKVRLKSL